MNHTFESDIAYRQYKKERYLKFLEGKIIQTPAFGFEVEKEWLLKKYPILKPHQVDIIQWALEGGRRAIFAQFGLGKTMMQLILADIIASRTNKPFLIGIPLGVKQEFYDDAKILGIEIEYAINQQFVSQEKYINGTKIFLSNYERIREGNFDTDYFGGVSFDEGDAIRNLDTETTDYIMNNFSRVPFRFIATATPSPNDYTEILNYAQFLGVMDRSQALTRFFQRNSTTAGDLTLYPHKVKEFWLWVRSWAIIIQKPSDLGYSDEGYDLPALKINYHEVKVKDRGVIIDRDKNVKMFSDPSKGLIEAAKEKRESIVFRMDKAMEIISESPDDHFILWHHLEAERKAIEKSIPEVRSVFGTQKMEQKESAMIGFKQGKFKYLAPKPEIAGSGCNFQNHCHRAIFLGIDYRFKDFIQAIHRILRFNQKFQVEIDIIYTDAELQVLKVMLEKWDRHNEMVQRMSEIIKEYGLSNAKLVSELRRTIGVERKEASGTGWKSVYNDNVLETIDIEDNKFGMILSSIPFSDQYEYCESYHDMGHNDGNEEFFQQMDFLTPELFRILKPGRIAAIHVKDRIRFSYQNGQGFTSLIDFAGLTIAHFQKHGFHLISKRQITTDVVRENNQTYRLGYSEQCKDSSKMGCGSPEYLLEFRKPPSDKSNAYADEPVKKSKQEYTLGRWQIDAHSLWRSSGNRLLTPEELRKHDLSRIGKIWKDVCLSEIYDYDNHVKLCDDLAAIKKLPTTFMAVPPRTNDANVWDDVNRMLTLNTSQALKKKEKHVCPLQFDIIDRAIIMDSNEDDEVLDMFGGVSSTAFRCVLKLKRKATVIELNEQYWKDGLVYLREAEYKNQVPTLFDLIDESVNNF